MYTLAQRVSTYLGWLAEATASCAACQEWKATARSLTYLALALLATALLGACDLLGGGGPTPTPFVLPTPTRTPIPTPTLTPTPLPTPTPTPIRTNLSQGEVELLIFRSVSSCAEQVAAQSETQIEMTFTSVFSPQEQRWVVEAAIREPPLSFGFWQVLDTTGEVTPLDQVARDIAIPDVTCNLPTATLTTGPTPPLVLLPTPTPTPVPTPTPTLTPTSIPTPTPTPVPVVASAEEAEVLVWVASYNCFADKPPLDAFTAVQEAPLRWVVEGRTPPDFDPPNDPRYGLWLVDGLSGAVTAWDSVAAAQVVRACYRLP